MWYVRAASRWTALRAGRGGGDRVQERGATTTNATDGGGCRIERGNENIKKIG